MVDNKDFFDKKKKWSTYKDSLLGCYLVPYYQKILISPYRSIYIDGFAGKGRFGDGSIGSPLIAIEKLKLATSQSKSPRSFISLFFIEAKHYQELNLNLKNAGAISFTVFPGKFEDQIGPVLYRAKGSNLFLYCDPYGISSIDSSFFIKLGLNRSFHSVEVLLNFNSFGFFREGCRLLAVTIREADDFVDAFDGEVTSTVASIEKMNQIIGTKNWQEIINRYRERKIHSAEAEKELTALFCKSLSSGFSYVLHMPIRASNDTHPKYQMIHMTNYRDGCLLMADNMYKRSQTSTEENGKGQGYFLDFDADGDVTNDSIIRKEILSLITEKVGLKDLQAKFYTQKGILCSTSKFNALIKELENESLLSIIRYPAYTSHGTKTFFMADDSKQKVWVDNVKN